MISTLLTRSEKTFLYEQRAARTRPQRLSRKSGAA
jgi:hypothetical protein